MFDFGLRKSPVLGPFHDGLGAAKPTVADVRNIVASRLGLYVLLLSPGTDLTRSIASSAGPPLSRFGVTHGENLSPCPLLSLSSTVR
jgi:hypothetical protein